MSCGPFDLNCTQIAKVLGVRPEKVPQALYSSQDGHLSPFDKTVLLLEAYPAQTLAAISKRLRELQRQRPRRPALPISFITLNRTGPV